MMREYVQQAAGSAPAASTADELAKLADLKAKGVIDDAEYASLKAKALGLSAEDSEGPGSPGASARPVSARAVRGLARWRVDRNVIGVAIVVRPLGVVARQHVRSLAPRCPAPSRRPA